MPTKRPIFLYSLLAILFAITLIYQVRYLPDFARGETKRFPFFFVASASNRIELATQESAGYGIHTGDQLLAVNGVPYTGTGLLGHAFNSAQVGVPIVVTVSPSNAHVGDRRDISLPVTAAQPGSWDVASDVVLAFFLPGASLLLGN